MTRDDQTPDEVAAHLHGAAVQTVAAWLQALAQQNWPAARTLSTFTQDELESLATRLVGVEGWAVSSLPRLVSVDLEDVVCVRPSAPARLDEPAMLSGHQFRVHHVGDECRVVALVGADGETFPDEPRLIED
jgi:hypothetical protein